MLELATIYVDLKKHLYWYKGLPKPVNNPSRTAMDPLPPTQFTFSYEASYAIATKQNRPRHLLLRNLTSKSTSSF